MKDKLSLCLQISFTTMTKTFPNKIELPSRYHTVGLQQISRNGIRSLEQKEICAFRSNLAEKSATRKKESSQCEFL